MSARLLHYALRYGANAASIVIAAVAIWRCWSRRPSWAWPLALGLGVAFVARTVDDACSADNWGHDFKFCWQGGAYALEEKDPYTLTGLLPPHDKEPAFVYPPYTLPLFQVFALVPEKTAIAIWTAVNVFICLVLGLMARQALIALDGPNSQVVEPWVAALLTGPLILSLAGHFGIEAGQFSFLITLALLGALALRTRPAVAGACLAVASIKIQTMAPFLLLFLKRSDRWTWLFLGLFMVALLLGAGNPADLPERIRTFLSLLETGHRPGFAFNTSLLNDLSHTMIGFDHALARIGIGGPSVVGALNYLCIAALGVLLAYLAIGKPQIPRGAICALVSLYSLLFLYHRLYDLVILIIPLVYCASRFRLSSGPVRWCYGWGLAAIVLALNVPYGEYYRLQRAHASHPILTALVLPSATYLILSAIAALALAIFLESKQRSTTLARAPGSPPTSHDIGAVWS